MTEILDARAAVERILDECALPAYLFTVEPKTSGWTLTIDCPVDGAWRNVVLPVDGSELRASLHDAALRQKLRREWQPHLAGGLP
ncbi:MAG TPA: hypothetical protein VEQ87_05320 [Burkholderiales bacterium]|nr:hypothetical protein [Burkholderiales bacterium]